MLSINNLTLGYGSRILIDNATVQLPSGALIALIGRNGTGKSTLLRAMAKMGNAREISFVSTERVRVSNLNCHDVVGFGRAPYTDWIGRLSQQDELIVQHALAQVGMQEYAVRTMDCMSDGECQRVMIARALAQQTPVILMDEPTSFLDMPNRYEMCLLLKRLAHEEQKTIVFSTHELDIALSICDNILLIDTPQLLFGTAAEIAKSPAMARLFRSANVRYNPQTMKVEI